jgi:hypothetical protein
LDDGGAMVLYDYHFDESGNWLEDAEPTGPEWVRKLLGDGVFNEIREIGYLGNDDLSSLIHF